MAIDRSLTDQPRINDEINKVGRGGQDNVGICTLRASQTTTTVIFVNSSLNAHISLTPLTANAAAEQAAGQMFISSRPRGSFTVTHRNNAQIDRTFSFECTGSGAA